MSLIEVRPMAHPLNSWGVYHIRDRRFIASYPEEVSAWRFSRFGYLDEHFRSLAAQDFPYVRLRSLVGD